MTGLLKDFREHGALKRLRFFIFMGLIILIAWYISTYWYQITLIHGRSMEPSYHNFQLVVLDKHFTASEIERGDVIAFRCEGLSAVLVKRVVAVPGDTVVIREGALYVNGEISPLYEGVDFSYVGMLGDEMVVGTDCFVVIGDNVAESKDSRYEEVGMVEYGKVRGRVIRLW